jgi:hypothetical protein
VTRAFLLLLLLLLTGCSAVAGGSMRPFDALRGHLHSATRLSGALSLDLKNINRGMKHDNKRWIMRTSARLHADAGRLDRLALSLQGKVKAAMNGNGNSVERRYERLTLNALTEQRWEAHWAALLARTIRSDPLLLSQSRYHAALSQGRMATRSAAASVATVRRARALRQAHPSSFKYAISSSSWSFGPFHGGTGGS